MPEAARFSRRQLRRGARPAIALVWGAVTVWFIAMTGPTGLFYSLIFGAPLALVAALLASPLLGAPRSRLGTGPVAAALAGALVCVGGHALLCMALILIGANASSTPPDLDLVGTPAFWLQTLALAALGAIAGLFARWVMGVPERA